MLKQLALRILPETILKPLRKRHYLKVLENFTADDEPDLSIVQQLIKPDSLALDIGANFGLYSVFLARCLTGGGRVCAVEPIPPTYEVLTANLAALGLANVTAINCAVSDRAGSAQMAVPAFDTGGKNFYQARLVDDAFTNQTENCSTYSVQVNTLDAIASNFGSPISFVKIDVEGFELPAVRGGEQLLQTDRPACLIEVSDNPDQDGSSAAELFKFFSQLNYQAFWYNGLDLKQRVAGDIAVNYFFLQTHHLEMLQLPVKEC